MLSHVVQHGSEAIFDENDVGIYESQIFVGAVLDSDVVGTGKTKVAGIADQLDVRKTLRDQIGSAVGRSVIDHDDFGVNGATILLQSFQALHHALLRVPNHDNDGNQWLIHTLSLSVQRSR